MKRILVMLLALAMVLSLLAACGGSNAETPSTQEPNSAGEETPTQAPDDTNAPPDDEQPGDEPASGISYPIADGDVTFTMLQVYNPDATVVYGSTGDYSDAETYQDIADATGVNIEFNMLAEATFSTQIDLIIAGGDTPDLYGRSIGSYDSRVMQAVDDGVVIDIMPLVEENAPDLYALLESDDYWKTQLLNSDGSICKIAGYNLSKVTEGAFIRGDWLEELNLEVPTNLEELTSVLEAFKTEYDCSLALLLDADLGSALDYLFNFKAMGFKDFNFMQDAPNSKKLIASITSDAYIDYLLTLSDYMKKGIITSDFLNTSKDNGNLETLYISGNSGVWRDDAKYTYNNAYAALDKNPNWVALPIAFDKTDYHVNDVGNGGGVALTVVYISGTCENPELALQFLNFGYTDEGAQLVQAGTEDVTFEYDESGKMKYTDLILENPDGYTINQAKYVYLTDAWMPTRQLESVFAMSYNEETLAAYDVFTEAYQGDDSMILPRDCFLSAEDQTEVFGLKSDILTLFSENAGKVILGDLDEAGYRQVIEQAYAQGLDRITEIYQDTYDRYLNGERNVGSAPGGPGGPPPDGAGPEGPPPA